MSLMSCLNTRYKLITLCCCITLIALISSIMVINAFFSWSETDHTAKTNTQITTTTLTTIFTEPPSDIHDGKLDIQINIYEITTSSSSSTEARRKWLELQKYNAHSSKSNNIDLEIIDIDDDTVQEISGSGMNEDNESGEDVVTFVPLDTKTKPSSITSSTAVRLDGETYELTASTLVDDIIGSSETTPIGVVNGQSGSTDDDISISGSITDHKHSLNSVSSGEVEVPGYHIGSSVTQPPLPDQDKCEQWLNCEDPFLKDYVKKFTSLPSCPCKYPLLGMNGIYDSHHKQIFRWRDPGYSKAYLAAYYKGAQRCIRSEVQVGTLAAQNCCYDSTNTLLTRGAGAGTPDVISPDVSSALHQLVDKVPWILCRGDWTKYNIARPPNNARMCAENPPKMEYLYQIWFAKNQ